MNELFWQEAEPDKPLTRSPGFLTQLPLPAYVNAYETLLTHVPKPEWDLEILLNEIHHRSEDCKPLMLHVCFWFNPDLVEPANRAENKEPMFYHLKPAFSRYRPSQSAYEKDESWKPEAMALQRAVIVFLMEHWELSKFEARYCKDPHITYPGSSYSDRFQNSSWYELVLLVRNNTSVPFKHPDLLHFNIQGKVRLPVVTGSAARKKPGDHIPSDYESPSSPSTSHSSDAYDSALEEVSPPIDYTKRPPKRKASVLDQKSDEDGNGVVYSEISSPTRKPSHILKLKMPPQWIAKMGADMAKASNSAKQNNINSITHKAELPANIPIGHPVGQQAERPAKSTSSNSIHQLLNPSVDHSTDSPIIQNAVSIEHPTPSSHSTKAPVNTPTDAPVFHASVPPRDVPTAPLTHPTTTTTHHHTMPIYNAPGPGSNQANPPPVAPKVHPSSAAPTSHPTFVAVNNVAGTANQPVPSQVNGLNQSWVKTAYRPPYVEEDLPSPSIPPLRPPTPPRPEPAFFRPTGFWPSEAVPRPHATESTPPATTNRADGAPARAAGTNSRAPSNDEARTVVEAQAPRPTIPAPSRTPSNLSEKPASNPSIPELQRIAIAADNVASREQANHNGPSEPQSQTSARRNIRRPMNLSERSFRILPPPSDGAHVPRSSSERRRSPLRHRPSTYDKKTKTELAIVLLEQQYSSKLSLTEMVTAIDVITRENNATVFVTLASEKLRDAWLLRAIQTATA